MTKQVKLYAEEFERQGKIKDLSFCNGEYDSLKINRIGNGRVYFMAMNKQIGGKVGTLRKQMQFEGDKVIISFGKNDKLIIGEYETVEEINL